MSKINPIFVTLIEHCTYKDYNKLKFKYCTE